MKYNGDGTGHFIEYPGFIFLEKIGKKSTVSRVFLVSENFFHRSFNNNVCQFKIVLKK